MRNSGKTILPCLLAAFILASCTGATATLLPTSAPSPLPPTATALPEAEQIVYYYFVKVPDIPVPGGSVVVMPDAYILAPARSSIPYSQDSAADLRHALETVLNEERNLWISSDLEIINVAFEDGHASVILEGEYFGVGSVTLMAARWQILLTLFANAAVQTATVTLNGGNISNIDISHSMDAKPDDYAYTRAEIEAFMTEHTVPSP